MGRHNQHENQPGTFNSSYRLFWQSYGYHHKRYENQLGTCTVLMDHFGNLQVTNKIGIYCGNLMVTITTNTKISLEHSKVLMDYIGNLQVTSKIGICCGNLMVTITADMKIGLEHSNSYG